MIILEVTALFTITTAYRSAWGKCRHNCKPQIAHNIVSFFHHTKLHSLQGQAIRSNSSIVPHNMWQFTQDAQRWSKLDFYKKRKLSKFFHLKLEWNSIWNAPHYSTTRNFWSALYIQTRSLPKLKMLVTFFPQNLQRLAVKNPV